MGRRKRAAPTQLLPRDVRPSDQRAPASAQRLRPWPGVGRDAQRVVASADDSRASGRSGWQHVSDELKLAGQLRILDCPHSTLIGRNDAPLLHRRQAYSYSRTPRALQQPPLCA